MDPQLVHLQEDIPYLFHVVEQTIQNAYQHSQRAAAGVQNSPLFQKRGGFMIHSLVEAMLQRSLEEVNFSGITTRVASNENRSAVHLEIDTPYGIIMIAKVSKAGGVPRSAKYRQKYIDQTFVADIYPEYRMFTGDCKPLYIITHCPENGDTMHADIRIGRLSVDQTYWSCNYPFTVFDKAHLIEDIIPVENATEKEEIQRTSRIILKKA